VALGYGRSSHAACQDWNRRVHQFDSKEAWISGQWMAKRMGGSYISLTKIGMDGSSE
jgi:hypothetical protein